MNVPFNCFEFSGIHSEAASPSEAMSELLVAVYNPDALRTCFVDKEPMLNPLGVKAIFGKSCFVIMSFLDAPVCATLTKCIPPNPQRVSLKII
jgi:hypothetical protein